MSQLRTNSIVPLDGLPAGASGGGIVQVVQTSYATQTTSTSSSWTTIFSASITPRSTNNKILIHASVLWGFNYNGEYCRVANGTTPIQVSSSGLASQVAGHAGSHYGESNFLNYNSARESWIVVDSPGSTSAQTYNFQVIANGGTVYINRNQFHSARVFDPAGISFLTLMEISG
jgi:hypothetical protein